MRPLRASVLRRVGLLLPRQGWMLDAVGAAAAAAAAVLCCAKLLMWGRIRGERGREKEGGGEGEVGRQGEMCTISTWRWRELPRKCSTGLPDAAIRWRLRRGCPHARTVRHVFFLVFLNFLVRAKRRARGARLKHV